LAQAIFEPNLFLYKYSNSLKPCHSSYLSTYEDGKDSGPKCRDIKFRCRGITQKKAYNNNKKFHRRQNEYNTDDKHDYITRRGRKDTEKVLVGKPKTNRSGVKSRH
jgi:hypothetical protein